MDEGKSFGEDLLGELKKKLPGFGITLAGVNAIAAPPNGTSQLILSLAVVGAYFLASTLDPLFDECFRPATDIVRGKGRLWFTRAYENLEKARCNSRKALGLNEKSPYIYRLCKRLFENTPRWSFWIEFHLQVSKALRTLVFLSPGLGLAIHWGTWPAAGPVVLYILTKTPPLCFFLAPVGFLFGSFWARIKHMEALYAVATANDRKNLGLSVLVRGGADLPILVSDGRLLERTHFIENDDFAKNPNVP